MAGCLQRHLDDSAERFDAFLDHRMDAHWAAQRHALLRASMGAPGDGGRGPPGTPALLDGGGSAAGLLTPASGAVAVRASTSSPYPSAEVCAHARIGNTLPNLRCPCAAACAGH